MAVDLYKADATADPTGSGASDEYYFDLTLSLVMNPVAGAEGVMFGLDVFAEPAAGSG